MNTVANRGRPAVGGGGLEMVTARLFNCSNTLRNIHTTARENITRIRAKRKVGYFFVAHPVLTIVLLLLTVFSTVTRCTGL